MLGEGMVAGVESQVDGPLPILRDQRKRADVKRFLLSCGWDGAEVAEPTEPTQFVYMGAVSGIPETLSAAEAADCSQLVHPMAREVSFTEEPDVGNLQVRFCEGH